MSFTVILQVTKNLLGTDVGVTAMMYMHDIIIKSSVSYIVRGGIFYLTHMVWGPNKILNLKPKTAQLLIALEKVICINIIIVSNIFSWSPVEISNVLVDK